MSEPTDQVAWCFTCGISSNESNVFNDICDHCYESFSGKPREKPIESEIVVNPPVQEQKEMPTEFNSFEEMAAFAASLQKNCKHPKKAPVEKPDMSTVYQEIHFYVRPGDTWQSLLRDAKEEKEGRNTNIEVQAHNHIYGVECNKSCRKVTS